MWNLFEVNNKDTRKTSIQPVCRLYKLWTYSIHCPGESVFESADWVKCPSYDNYSKAALLKYENQVVTKRCHSDLLTKTGEKDIFDQHSWHYVHKNQKSIEKNLNNIDTPKTKPNFATTVLEIVFREKADFYWWVVLKKFSDRLSSFERCSSLSRLSMTLQSSLLRTDKASLLEIFGSLKIRNFGYTPSCLQLLRKPMSNFSLFFLCSSFSYFRKSLILY